MTENPLRSGIELSALSAGSAPQDDLFRHVNGAWLARTEIPEDKARWGSFHLIAEQAEKDVRAIIEESTDAEPGTEARKIGDLFTSFMDTARIEELGATPLAGQLAASTPSTPFRRSCARRRARARVSGHDRRLHRARPGQPERYVVFFVQSGLSLPDESYYRLDNFADPHRLPRVRAKILGLAGVEILPRRPTASRARDRDRRAPLGQRARATPSPPTTS
jgi:putative endopeptidase